MRKFNIFWARAGTTIPLRIHKNTPFQVGKSFFSGEEAWPLLIPLPTGRVTPPASHLSPLTKLSGSVHTSLAEFQPDLRHCL